MTWTKERRAAQAERIRKTKPWLKATGPRTEEGKKRTRMNALKHGNRSEHIRQARKALRLHREIMRLLTPLLANPAFDPIKLAQTKYKESLFKTDA